MTKIDGKMKKKNDKTETEFRKLNERLNVINKRIQENQH